ncbi:MAG: glycosyltransferase [Bryobacterales bacterium]|nr:glycosyltransferase [Bryobacterales bacterium]
MRDSIHILHVFSTFGLGGPQLRVANIINSLGPAFRHTILPMDRNSDAACRIAPGACVHFIMPPERDAGRPHAMALHNTIRNIHPDLLVGYNWGAMDAVLAAVVGRLCPVIQHEHGFGIDEAHSLKFRRVLARRILLKAAHCTIVPSKVLYDIAITRYRLAAEKVRLIPNGVDTKRFRPGHNPELRGQLGTGGLLFGYVGQLRPEKNLGLLIRAFALANIEDARLVLVGDGPCRPELEHAARELGVLGKVIFTGKVQDPLPYLGALDVFVMSSVSEQMPMSLLEAMACGLPALCTDVGDIREMLGEPGAPVAVPPENPGVYADAMRLLAHNFETRAALGAGNRERCIARYSLERMVRCYEDEYYAALGLSRAHVSRQRTLHESA